MRGILSKAHIGLLGLLPHGVAVVATIWAMAVAAKPALAPSAFLEKANAATAGARCEDAFPTLSPDGTVATSALIGSIGGFAVGTTGGQGKPLIVVANAADAKSSPGRPAPAGSLRAAVDLARQHGGGWIVFGPELKGRQIRLEAGLQLPSNVTIDGGCTQVEIISNARITQLEIAGAENIIVKGLIFARDAYDDKENKTGDAVGLTGSFDRIAVLHNNFRRCGDGCVDIVRKDRITDVTSRVTVAFNHLENHNKVMLVGTLTCYKDRTAQGCDNPNANLDGPLKPSIFVTIAGNVFDRTSQRHPKVVSNAAVHFVNNLVVLAPTHYSTGEDSAVYGAAAGGGGVLVAEGNIFVNPSNGTRVGAGSISAVRAANGGGSEPDGVVALRDNAHVGSIRFSEKEPARALAFVSLDRKPLMVPEADPLELATCLLRKAGVTGGIKPWPLVCTTP